MFLALATFLYISSSSLVILFVAGEFSQNTIDSLSFSLSFSFFLPFRATNRWHALRAHISAGSVLPLFVLTYISKAPPRKPSHERPILFFLAYHVYDSLRVLSLRPFTLHVTVTHKRCKCIIPAFTFVW